MRRFSRVVLAAALVLGVAIALPSHAASGYKGFVNEHAYVATPVGNIYVQYWRPTDPAVKVPVILSISPYRYLYARLDPRAPITDTYSDRYVPRGYARAYADLVGTGLSDGCYNYGGKNEAIANAAVIEWLGTRPWTNGKIGMIGTSYDGATQLEAATLAPKHLAAIVPQEPVSIWYHYNYDHGVLYNGSDEKTENVDQTGYPVGTPDLFDFVLGRTPNTDPGLTPAQRVANLQWRLQECGDISHEAKGHGAQTEYDAFWQERDWALRADKVTAAVLYQQGWDDNNTKSQQFQRFFDHLTHAADKRAIAGQWVHTDVFDGGAAASHWPIVRLDYLDAYFAHWLKGAPASVLDGFPKILSEGSDKQFRTTLPFGVKRTVTALPTQAARFTNTGAETSMVIHETGSLPNSPNYWVSELKPVSADSRLTGIGKIMVTASSTGLRGQLDAALVDVDSAGAASVICVGLSDLRYRNNPAVGQDLSPGKAFSASVSLTPQDYILKAGHHFAIVLSGSNLVWGVSDPEAGQVVTIAKATLSLPVLAAKLNILEP